MADLSADEIARRNERFFNWFERRLANARTLAKTPTTRPEASLVLAAGLDALARFWAETLKPDLVERRTAKGKMAPVPDRERFSSFLREMSGHPCFDRVSVPTLLRAVDERWPAEGATLRAAFAFRDASSPGLRRVRDWTHDPEIAAVKSHLRHHASPEAFEAIKKGELLERSQFGQILYKEFRCCHVHEVQQSGDLELENHPERTEPWYRNISRPVRGAPGEVRHYKRLVIPWEFIAGAFESALSSFRAQCVDRGTIPKVMR